LQGRGGEENFLVVEGCVLDVGGDLAGLFVDVTEAVGFVNDNEVPGFGSEFEGSVGGELVRADDDLAAGRRR
jgi:hypothetical protein